MATRLTRDRCARRFLNAAARRFSRLVDDPDGVGALVRTHFPESAAQLIARADRAANDRFDVLGHEGLSYGAPIDWHRDPIADRRAPLVHWSRVPYLDAAVVGDHKVIWELNRHQHFIVLCQAYWLTGDERYALAVARQLEAWMDANPPKLGINWASSLEVAFRVISWCWASAMLRHSDSLTPRLWMRVLKYLNVHAHHIEAHRSTYFSPNTHLTGEALGLLYVGTLFPELRAAPRWRELGWSILEQQLPRHIRADGVYYEQTTWYQRYTVEFYLHALLLRTADGRTVSDATRRLIELSLEPLIQFMRPDGTTPLIGDDDGGRLPPHHPAAPNDFRSTLALAASVFDRADCAALGAPARGVVPWLLGVEGARRFDRIAPPPPRDTARVFSAGGYVVSRSEWSSDADFLLIDCGGRGSSTGGHAHADAFAFELAFAGRTLLVDPGTFSYIEPERDTYRRTDAHNAVTVDGCSSSEPGAAFGWLSEATGTIERWQAAAGFAFVSGRHDGFERLTPPASYVRSVLTVHGAICVVCDRLASAGEHEMTAHFHADAGLVFEPRNDGRGATLHVESRANESVLELLTVAANARVECATATISPAYGTERPSSTCTVVTRAVGNDELVTFLVPADGVAQASLVELPARRGRVFSIVRGHSEQLVGIGDDGIDAGDVRTDATWFWLRRDPGSMVVDECLLLDGSRLEVAGAVVPAEVGARCRPAARPASASTVHAAED